jgi:hypothetical protein
MGLYTGLVTPSATVQRAEYSRRAATRIGSAQHLAADTTEADAISYNAALKVHRTEQRTSVATRIKLAQPNGRCHRVGDYHQLQCGNQCLREGTRVATRKLQAASGKLQAASCKLQAANCKLQAASCKLQAASYKLQAASCKLQAASCKLQAASCKLQAASCKL